MRIFDISFHNKKITQVIFIIGLIVLLSGCDKNLPLSNKENIAKNIQINSKAKFDICSDKACVNDSTVLGDLYPFKGVKFIGSIGIIPNFGMFSIVKSIKYFDGKDEYAIFITQLNPFDDKGEIATCHVCSVNMGIAVYQKHNDWKLFTKSIKLATIGEWGMLLGYESENAISIISGGVERFVIRMNSSSMGQGYASTYMNLVGISPKGVNQYSHPSITYLGSIETSESSSGSISPTGNDWIGDVSFEWDAYPAPIIRLNKKYESKDKESVVIYKYRDIDRSYLPFNP